MPLPKCRTVVVPGGTIAEDLADFPVYVAVDDVDLRGVDHGGSVADPRGRDIAFWSGDGRAELQHEIESFDPAAGKLRAWVRVPQVRRDVDTQLQLRFGQAPTRPAPQRDFWSSFPGVRCVYRHSGVIPHSSRNAVGSSVTVEAWVQASGSGAETPQTLVAKWSLRQTMTAAAFDAVDVGRIDGLDTTGYFGAIFDGRYVYFAPQHDTQGRHAKVLRFDTHGKFDDAGSWSAYDASGVDGLVCKGYYGGLFDGRFVYFMPRFDGERLHSRVLRYDTRGEFKDRSSWSACDVGVEGSYQSCGFDGRYLYLCPGHIALPGKPRPGETSRSAPPPNSQRDGIYCTGNSIVVRYDTTRDFKSPESWTRFDIAGLGGLNTTDFDGIVFDGRYLYLAPLCNYAAVRYDTTRPFDDRASWSVFDTQPLGMDMCVGAVFDGRHVYYTPYGKAEWAIRYNVSKPFEDAGSWERYDIRRTPGLPIRGWDGLFADGRYIYFVPFYDGDKTMHGVVLRYDTSAAFDDPGSWSWFDAGRTRGLLTTGYNAGASDGRFLYMAPWRDGNVPERLAGHGRVLRYDTLDDGAFALHYCDLGHNGGLNAALPGPRFIVNTTAGPVSVAANRALSPGWHYLAGVFDGRTVRLYVDGELVGEREAPGHLCQCGADLAIGQLPGGGAVFAGDIRMARIAATARSAGWIRTAFENLRSPASFQHR